MKGRVGDRSLDQQLTGLQPLVKRVPGKSVLDVGAAEGLISIRLIDEGAMAVHGLEHRADFVKVANELRGDRACTFEVVDANTYAPVRQYDIVLMLAILQKLRNPYEACLRFAQAARELVVIRLPPKHAPYVIDERSGGDTHDMEAALYEAGFIFKAMHRGHLGEFTGYYEHM
jgi:SAM-dependent methyltransferase